MMTVVIFPIENDFLKTPQITPPCIYSFFREGRLPWFFILLVNIFKSTICLVTVHKCDETKTTYRVSFLTGPALKVLSFEMVPPNKGWRLLNC